MSHEIDEDRYIGSAPTWHMIGTYPGRVVTAAEAIAATRLDYGVELFPIFVPLTLAGGAGLMMTQVEDRFATVRMDVGPDDPRRVLGIVGKNYTVLPNDRAFEFFDAVVGQDAAIYESAGVLNGGKEIFVVARLQDQKYWVKDDEYNAYITLTNAHTGQHGVRIFTTMVRVVCQNTLMMALRNTRKFVTLRHTANVESRLRNVPVLLGLADAEFRAKQELFRKLAETPIPAPPMFQAYVDDVFPSAGEKPNERTTSHRETVSWLMNHEHQNTPGIGNTYYAAFNAVTEYVDHGISRFANAEDQATERAVQALFGRGNDLKKRALDLAVTHARANAGASSTVWS